MEGDSAGGSAEGGRFREFQAILPLRGKIINAYKSREDKVLANEEVQSMIQAIGCGIGADQDVAKRRYNKIIIMTDADVDGSHIRTLLLCFFYRQMYHLVANGHVYLAQPPLFRVVRGKSTRYYVQTEEEMRTQLLERGLSDCWLEMEDGRRVEGDAMRKLCETLGGMEDDLIALERRGVSLKEHLTRFDPQTRRLPMFMLSVGGDVHWFQTRDALESFIQDNNIALEGKKDEAASENGEGDEAQPPTKDEHVLLAHYLELHEVKSINTGIKDLVEQGFATEDLVPEERTGSTESKFHLHREESRTGIDDLRALLPAVRSAGEKGMQVTRFKGLGEMNPEELRETTLDRSNRTLVQVSLTDAAAADEMFRVLMGDKVEPRRQFIEKHALEVRNLDV